MASRFSLAVTIAICSIASPLTAAPPGEMDVKAALRSIKAEVRENRLIAAEAASELKKAIQGHGDDQVALVTALGTAFDKMSARIKDKAQQREWNAVRSELRDQFETLTKDKTIAETKPWLQLVETELRKLAGDESQQIRDLAWKNSNAALNDFLQGDKPRRAAVVLVAMERAKKNGSIDFDDLVTNLRAFEAPDVKTHINQFGNDLSGYPGAAAERYEVVKSRDAGVSEFKTAFLLEMETALKEVAGQQDIQKAEADSTEEFNAVESLKEAFSKLDVTKESRHEVAALAWLALDNVLKTKKTGTAAVLQFRLNLDTIETKLGNIAENGTDQAIRKSAEKNLQSWRELRKTVRSIVSSFDDDDERTLSFLRNDLLPLLESTAGVAAIDKARGQDAVESTAETLPEIVKEASAAARKIESDYFFVRNIPAVAEIFRATANDSGIKTSEQLKSETDKRIRDQITIMAISTTHWLQFREQLSKRLEAKHPQIAADVVRYKSVWKEVATQLTGKIKEERLADIRSALRSSQTSSGFTPTGQNRGSRQSGRKRRRGGVFPTLIEILFGREED